METAGDRAGMLAAIAAARRNLRRPDGGPFGACIVKEGRVLAVARNTVLARRDPTCHAEVNAIRAAARLGFRELTISNRTMRRLGGCAVEIIPGVLRGECLELLREWEKRHRGTVY